MEGSANQKKVIRSSPGAGSERISLRLRLLITVFLKPPSPLQRNFLDKYESNLSEIGEMFK